MFVYWFCWPAMSLTRHCRRVWLTLKPCQGETADGQGDSATKAERSRNLTESLIRDVSKIPEVSQIPRKVVLPSQLFSVPLAPEPRSRLWNHACASVATKATTAGRLPGWPPARGESLLHQAHWKENDSPLSNVALIMQNKREMVGSRKHETKNDE